MSKSKTSDIVLSVVPARYESAYVFDEARKAAVMCLLDLWREQLAAVADKRPETKPYNILTTPHSEIRCEGRVALVAPPTSPRNSALLPGEALTLGDYSTDSSRRIVTLQLGLMYKPFIKVVGFERTRYGYFRSRGRKFDIAYKPAEVRQADLDAKRPIPITITANFDGIWAAVDDIIAKRLAEEDAVAATEKTAREEEGHRERGTAAVIDAIRAKQFRTGPRVRGWSDARVGDAYQFSLRVEDVTPEIIARLLTCVGPRVKLALNLEVLTADEAILVTKALPEAEVPPLSEEDEENANAG